MTDIGIIGTMITAIGDTVGDLDTDFMETMCIILIIMVIIIILDIMVFITRLFIIDLIITTILTTTTDMLETTPMEKGTLTLYQEEITILTVENQ